MQTEKNNFLVLLRDIQNDLNSHKRTSDEVMYNSIQDRLNSALRNYTSDISDSTDYLCNRNSETIFRRITKD